MQKTLFIILISIISTTYSFCQIAPAPAISTFDDLKSAYSGNVEYVVTTKTVTFTSTGTINFLNRVEKTENIWHIPTSVIKVMINENVTVTGQFTWGHAMTFEGKDKYTSVVYGTSGRGVLNSFGLDKKYTCVAYSTFYGYGTSDNYIKNLTCLNPLGFMFTGKNNCRLHLDGVRGIDDRGGFSNHSDGISSASGSTVKNCYFETGDDAIKVYANIYVENTDIVMVQNCVPIQYGWGTYGSGAVGTFKNVRITGNDGRNSEKFVINMASTSAGTGYNKTIIMDSCVIENPNGTLFLMGDNTVKSDITITNSRINVKDFGQKFGIGTITICGTTEKLKQYDCLAPANVLNIVEDKIKIWPNPCSDVLYVETKNPNISIYSILGQQVNVTSHFNGNTHSINTKQLNSGNYIISNYNKSELVSKK